MKPIHDTKHVSHMNKRWRREGYPDRGREKGEVESLTERMATRELGLLGVAGLQLVADAVEQLDVALLRVLLEGGDEGPGHGARCLGGDGGVGTAGEVLAGGKRMDER